MIMPGCMHYFCKECIKEYASELIQRGEIGKLYCPEVTGCKTMLNEIILRKCELPSEQLEKFNQFSFNQAIENMSDFSWCPVPECASPAEVD